jgi:hypothetical protein
MGSKPIATGIKSLSHDIQNKKIPLPHNSQGVPCFGTNKYRCSIFNQTERQAEIKPIVLSQK